MSLLKHWPTLNRQQQVLALGGPIMLAQFSQGLTNIVGTIMVASLDDAQALAGVGVGTYASLLTCFFVLGFSVAVQTLVARRIGEQRHSDIYEPLNAGLAIMLVTGLTLTTLVYLAAPWLMSLITHDPTVGHYAAEYYRYRSFSIAAIGINFCCRGFLSGCRKTQYDMVILIVVQASNMLLCYGFIFGNLGLPEMGAAGAGMAATVSFFIGTAIYLPVTFYQRWQHFFCLPKLRTIKQLVSLGLPNSSQQFFISLATLVLYALLGRVGTEDLAIAHAINNIALLIILAGNGFGTAATTLVSQAIGRKDIDDAYRWGHDCAVTALPLLCMVVAPIWLNAEFILGFFIPDNQSLITMAKTPLYITCLIIVVRVLTRSYGQALLGAGDSKRVMLSYALQQWGFFLPSAALACLLFNAGITTVWLIQLVSWGLQLAICIVLWQKRLWVSIKL
jgi:putative MATE family efflux protein